MPIRTANDTVTPYFLISYDENGAERSEDDGTKLSRAVIDRVADVSHPVTDVFLMSHGWQGDVNAAIRQYDAWVGAMAAVKSDVQYLTERRPNFNPIIVGLHWPSLPFGDEDIPDEDIPSEHIASEHTASEHTASEHTASEHTASEGIPNGNVPSLEMPTDNIPFEKLPFGDNVARLDHAVNVYAHRIADTPAARTAIRTILENSEVDANATVLLSPTKAAYETLFRESGLGAGDIGAAPGADQDGWDPQAILDEDKQQAHATEQQPEATHSGLFVSLFSRARNAVLSPLRQASFWAMKRRARIVGETGGHELLRILQTAAPATRFHLMGHSFGCIVMSAAVMGTSDGQALPRPVNSLLLVQGALSIWAFAPDIPYREGTPGYFYPLIKNYLVNGPIVTTRSEKDGAVGIFYPKGARLKRQLVLVATPYPKYGGVGTFGIQGAPNTDSVAIKHVDRPYAFQAGRIYNIEASRVICEGKFPVGAHSDIAKAEVAHIFWQAVLSGV